MHGKLLDQNCLSLKRSPCQLVGLAGPQSSLASKACTSATGARLCVQVLFLYAAERLQSHLEATFDTADTQKDVQLFREQVRCIRSW